MEKITVKIDGMMCGMCESHMNDTFRQNFKVKKVSSSHAKGETVAIVDEDIPDEKLKEAVEKMFEGTKVKRVYINRCSIHLILHEKGAAKFAKSFL